MTFLNEYVELGFKYPSETEPIRDLPTARLVVSSVNRSTLTRVSSRSEIVSQTHCRPRPELDIDLTPAYLSPGNSEAGAGPVG